MLKLSEIFSISLFSTIQIWVLRVNKFFCCSFWLIFCSLDPDQDPGSQNLANPSDPDPKHFLDIKYLPFVVSHKNFIFLISASKQFSYSENQKSLELDDFKSQVMTSLKSRL